MTLEHWAGHILNHDLKRGLRVGQSYMNNVKPTEDNPDLFHETDPNKAWGMIYELEFLR